METRIRRYRPGMFDTMLDAAVYHASLNGIDDHLGDVQDFGWYWLMHAPLLDIREQEALTHEELEFLVEQVGAIVSEDSQGFVTVEYYETTCDLNQAWAELEEAEEGWSTEVEEGEDR